MSWIPEAKESRVGIKDVVRWERRDVMLDIEVQDESVCAVGADSSEGARVEFNGFRAVRIAS